MSGTLSISPDGARCLAVAHDNRLVLHSTLVRICWRPGLVGLSAYPGGFLSLLPLLVSKSRARLPSPLPPQDASVPVSFSEKAHLAAPYTSAPTWLPSPDGDAALVALGNARGSVVVWDTRVGEVRARLGAAAGEGGKKRKSSGGGGASFSTPVQGLAWRGAADARELLACAEGTATVVGFRLREDGAIEAEGAPDAPPPVRTLASGGDKRGVARIAVTSEDVLFAGGTAAIAVSAPSAGVLLALAGHSMGVRAMA